MLKITNVRVSPAGSPTDKLKAYCSITIDGCFMVRGIKLIEGAKGLFIAMPSRKTGVDCPQCRHKNPSRMAFCGKCGHNITMINNRLPDNGNLEHADIAHPLNAECRKQILDAIMGVFVETQKHDSSPGRSRASCT